MTGSIRSTILLLLLAACAPRYPLDMTEEEWRALSPAQKLAARREEAEMQRLREQRLRAEAERRAEEARLARRREAERVATRYRTAPLRDFLLCSLDGGEVRFGEDWGPFFATSFSLLRGETRNIELVRTNGRDRLRIAVRYYENGERVKFCAGDPSFANKHKCANLRAGSSALRRGVHTILYARKLFRNTQLFCRRPKRRPPWRPAAGL